jgi:hypothetical protein
MAEEVVTEPIVETPETPVEPVVETPDTEGMNAVKADRTKQQFEKLTKTNAELAEGKKLAEAEAAKYKNLFESSRPVEVVAEPTTPLPPTPQVNPQLQGMIDENGYLDGNKLVGTLDTQEKRIKVAEEKAKKLEDERANEKKQAREREEKEATLKVYAKFPQLDPLNVEGVDKEGEVIKFDPKFYDYVYKELEHKAKRGEMPTNEDYMAAADQVYKDFYEGRDMNKKDLAVKTDLENKKRQINAVRPRSPINVGYYEGIEEKALVEDVRKGKRGAVGALLRQKGLR